MSRIANTGYAGKRATVRTTSYRPISGVRLVPSDADEFGDEADRAVMSPESVDAAAGTARAQVTYQYLEPADPGHPLSDGGFWGAFMRSLAGRWEQIKANADPTTGTFEDEEAEGQTQLVTDGGVQQTTECENCGKQRYTFERCQHCGNVHWENE